MSRPLEGIKVLELTTFVAAPCVCRLLADLGAEVIKIEKPTGDAWRKTGITYCPSEFSMDENPIYDIYNAGKKHIVLDLKTDEGKKVFHKLLGTADVFVTNTRLGGLKRLGISYDDVKDENPGLIFAMVEGFGEKGEDANVAAYDTTAFWSRCGMLHDLAVVDENGGHNPIYPPSSVGDTVTAYLLLSEITTALYQRNTTGKGQIVRAGLFHTGVFTFGTMQISTQRPFGIKYPKRKHLHTPVSGYFKCKDGRYLFIAAGVPAQTYVKVAETIGRSDLLEDERFSTIKACYQNGYEFHKILVDAFLTKTSDEWAELCKKNDLAFTKMNGFADVSEDEQAIVNGYIEEVCFRNGRTVKMPSTPLDMETLHDEDMSTHPAPLIGSNTDEILKEAGYTDKEIAELYKKDVITPKI